MRTSVPAASAATRLRGGGKKIGALCSLKDWLRRVQIWITLLCEYPALRRVYKSHEANGFFQYGSMPRSFDSIGEHDAMAQLLALRRESRCGPFSSTLSFKQDGAVLPTYLPVEQGAAAALGAVCLAAADLYEARTGRAQELEVRQTASGLMTASYLYFYAQPSGEWKGCHGFDQTMAAEGTVKPHRKAYLCGDGRHIFLHGGFPKLKKGITDFFGCATRTGDRSSRERACSRAACTACTSLVGLTHSAWRRVAGECTVESIGSKCLEWDAEALEAAMQRRYAPSAAPRSLVALPVALPVVRRAPL